MVEKMWRGRVCFTVGIAFGEIITDFGGVIIAVVATLKGYVWRRRKMEEVEKEAKKEVDRFDFKCRSYF